MGRFSNSICCLEKIIHGKVNIGGAVIIATELMADYSTGEDAGKKTLAGSGLFKTGTADAQVAHQNGFSPDPAGIKQDIIGGAIDFPVNAVNVIIVNENAEGAVMDPFP
ncbi:MAG: hypothetical protein KA369_01955 [Spirochaetes bacterium]|nr:hypothetical protein [Spirochaetota bacterium]